MPKFGGAPGNTAVGLAKLEQPNVLFAGKVGTDFFGTFLDNYMKGFGVDTRYLFRSATKPSTLAFVALSDTGERSFQFYPGAHETLVVNETNSIELEDVRIIQFGSLTQTNMQSKEATAALLERARNNGTYISYDPNVREALWPDLQILKTTILETLPFVDMVKINEEEMLFLTGSSAPEEAAMHLWHDSMQLLLITLGAKGAYWKTAAASGRVATIPVEVVDTTGAGDAFNAGLLSQLFPLIAHASLQASTEQIESAVAFANRVASLSTQKKGATEAIPTLAELS